MAYYKGETFSTNNRPYLKDYAGNNHAQLLNANFKTILHPILKLEAPKGQAEISINKIEQTVYQGIPVQLTATYSNNVNQLLWTIADNGIKDLNAVSPEITFNKAGKQTVEVTAISASGNKAKATYELTVEAAPACDASFNVSRNTVPANERVSFFPKRPMPYYRYEWSMPNAQEEKAYTINAGAQYLSKSTYPVTLTVTAPDGTTASSTQEITVVTVAPQAEFEIAPDVIVKGETTFLKDRSKYDPTEWQWLLTNNQYKKAIIGQHSSWTPEIPGIYDVSLKVKNEIGQNEKTLRRGLIVCNADSKNGLRFSNNANITLKQSPLEEGLEEFTVEWWMNPFNLSDRGMGMGDTEGNFLLACDREGKYQLTVGGKSVVSRPIVQPMEWHHYGIVFKNKYIYFYRDGKQVSQHYLGTAALPAIKDFHIGATAAPMNGQLDEFRVWHRALPLEQLKTYANAPIDDVERAVAEDKLALYYNFNQSGGDVLDATSRQNNGIRMNFGPDGDAWGLSRGVFCLNFSSENLDKVVTSRYLKNYKVPFQHTGVKVNSSFSNNRFFEIKNWTLENTVVKDQVTTGVHVDTGKSSSFTFTCLWDGFATLTDHKAYQTVTLPAGYYTFSLNYGRYEAECGNSYLVVAQGKGLPNTADIAGEALAATLLTDKTDGTSKSVSFMLEKETEVSLGLVINQSEKKCCTINDFKLTRSDVSISEADNADGFDLAIDESGFNTLYLPYPTYIPEGVTAYAAKALQGDKVILEPIVSSTIPAKTGVLVSAAAGNYHFAPSTAGGHVTSLLLGSTEEAEADPQKRYFTFSSQPAPGFYLNNGNTLPARQAYIVTDGTVDNECYLIDWVTAGIEQMEGNDEAADSYDIAGRKVRKPVKGLYIRNGKKVLVP